MPPWPRCAGPTTTSSVGRSHRRCTERPAVGCGSWPGTGEDAMVSVDSGQPMTVADAYRFCGRMTRARARNFWYGIRLLPGAKRAALSAVYAFARRVDDVTDEAGDAQAKLAALREFRHR